MRRILVVVLSLVGCSSADGGSDAGAVDAPDDADVADTQPADTQPADTGIADTQPVDTGADVPADTSGACATPETCPCGEDAECARFDDVSGCLGRHRCSGGRCQLDPVTVVICDTSADPPCKKTTCVGGLCVLAVLGDGAACDDHNPCTTSDVCEKGACSGTATAGCAIDGACWAPLALDPKNPCRRCDPSESPKAWSNVALGTKCDIGLCTLAATCNGAGACEGTWRVPGAPSLTGPTRPFRSGAVPATTRRPKVTWSPPADADVCGKTTYDLQLDDSCAGSWASCPFSSPEVSVTGLAASEWQPAADLPLPSVRPFGRRVAVRVRACNSGGCSGWSPSWFFDLGRVVNDLDGDGISDLVVAATNDGQGKLFVYAGSKKGLDTTPTWTLADPELGSAQLGQSVVVGDFDGDGFDDVVATQLKTGGKVRLMMFPGGATGPSSTSFRRLDLPTTGPYAKTSLTTSLARAADVDGDGLDDVLVAADAVPEAGESPPLGYLFAGHVGGPAVEPTWAIPGRVAKYWSDYDTLEQVAMDGDFDGDGNPDLIMGVRPSLGLTTFRTFRGIRGGPPVAWLTSTWGYSMLPKFGSRYPVAFADLDGDRLDDITFAGLESGEVGVDHVLSLKAATSITYPTIRLLPPADSGFGAALVVADLDGDGVRDLVVGDPGLMKVGKPGRAFVFRGPVTSSSVAAVTLSCDDDKGWFGALAVDAGDLDGNGMPDLVVSAWAYASSGRVYVYPGKMGALPTTPSVTLAHPTTLFAANFGANLGR